MPLTALLFLILTGVLTSNSQVVPCDTKGDVLFHCADGTCISRRSSYCNGTAECPDGSDEYAFDDSLVEERGMKCQYYRDPPGDEICHLPKQYKCDHEMDCVGGYDECDCLHTFKCDGEGCAAKVMFCNTQNDCLDASDEKKFNRTTKEGFQCPVTSTRETNICVLPERYLCDKDSDCDNGIDECFCDFSNGGKKGVYLDKSFSNEKCFRCLDRSLVIPNKQVCDGSIHCQDMSDECLCTTRKNYTMPDICNSVCDGTDCDCKGSLRCIPKDTVTNAPGEKVCIPPTAICDSVSDCADGIDELYCPDSHQFFQCYDGKMKIRNKLFCNGHNDCEDGSDEIYCKNLTNYFCYHYRLNFRPRDWDNETQTANIGIPGNIVLPRNYPFYAKRCDGIPTCPEMDDECYATGCDEPRPKFCDFVAAFGEPFRCPVSGSLILGVEICDGKPSCNDTNPEISEDELYCPDRFYCSDKGAKRLPIHLPLSSKCNGIQECDDQSDELGCPESTHFYCDDGGSKKFIRFSEVCDGTKDCSEGADECQNCNPNPFSSDENLISVGVLVAFLWIIGLVAVVGNLMVIFIQLKNLIKPEGSPSEVSTNNRILVLNLSMADILVGIYLFALGIKDASIGEYCQLDQEWRSSSTCSALGTIALIGTETSVFMLTIMTAYRLYLVCRPFKTQKVLFVRIFIGLSWAFSLLLAILPHAGSLKDYFVSCVWYRHNEFFGRICLSDMEIFTREMAKRDETGKFAEILEGGYTWNNMFDVVKTLNSTYVPERYFGYYSAHSVCLPKLFPDPKEDQSWGYSLFLVLLNFFAFIFILGSYIQIYRETTKSSVVQRAKLEDRAATIQRKVTRIVATDFCCWVPICIMAFVKVSGANVSEVAYAVTAIILIPINAAMNPFLYSDVLDLLWQKMMPMRIWCSETSCGKKLEQKLEARRRRAEALHESGVTKMTNVHTSQQTASNSHDGKDDNVSETHTAGTNM